MWDTLLRRMAGDKRELGYFPIVATLGKLFAPDDMYQGTEFAAANLKALRESGLRARFSYGTPQAHPPTDTIDRADLERLRRDWKSLSGEGLARPWAGLARHEPHHGLDP